MCRRGLEPAFQPPDPQSSAFFAMSIMISITGDDFFPPGFQDQGLELPMPMGQVLPFAPILSPEYDAAEFDAYPINPVYISPFLGTVDVLDARSRKCDDYNATTWALCVLSDRPDCDGLIYRVYGPKEIDNLKHGPGDVVISSTGVTVHSDFTGGQQKLPAEEPCISVAAMFNRCSVTLDTCEDYVDVVVLQNNIRDGVARTSFVSGNVFYHDGMVLPFPPEDSCDCPWCTNAEPSMTTRLVYIPLTDTMVTVLDCRGVDPGGLLCPHTAVNLWNDTCEGGLAGYLGRGRSPSGSGVMVTARQVWSQSFGLVAIVKDVPWELHTVNEEGEVSRTIAAWEPVFEFMIPSWASDDHIIIVLDAHTRNAIRKTLKDPSVAAPFDTLVVE